MSLLQRNYPHIKIVEPSQPLVIGNSVFAYGFAMPPEDVAQINVFVVPATGPRIDGVLLPVFFPFDWYANVNNLPLGNIPLKLVVEAVDHHGNTGRDSCFLSCQAPGNKAAHQPPANAQAVITIKNPGVSNNPCRVTTPGPFMTFGTITDSNLISQTTAKVTRNGVLVASGNGSPLLAVPQGDQWGFFFQFPKLSGLALLTVDAPGAVCDTRNLDFGV